MNKIKHFQKWILIPELLSLLLGGVYVRYIVGRPAPIHEKRQLFQGVTYYRKVSYLPHSMIAHILTIDTKSAKGVHFLVTPPDHDGTVAARTTSQFMQEFGVQIAINGDGFFPWWSRSPLDYYPHVGDPVTPNGFTSSSGTVYADGKQNANPEPTLYITGRGAVEFNHAPREIYHSLSGDRMLIQSGQLIEELDNTIRQPRTGIGTNRNGRWLYIIVIDGRQPFYSNGATYHEMAKLLLGFGAFNAMALDGGGSSTMVIQGTNKKPVILNSPIDNYIPGRERPVANHLGIYLNP